MCSLVYLYFQLQLPLHSYLYYVGSQADTGAKLPYTGDWEKANRISCWQTLIRTVYLNQRGIITSRGMPAHCWKILTSAQFCRRPPDPGAWSYAVGWWGWSGQSDCLQRFLCSSLKLFIVVPFECGTALLKDKADEDYPSWNRALLARPWNPSSQLVTHLGTSSVGWQERWRVTAATDQTRRIHYR